jgi:hypothetical protein
MGFFYKPQSISASSSAMSSMAIFFAAIGGIAKSLGSRVEASFDTGAVGFNHAWR